SCSSTPTSWSRPANDALVMVIGLGGPFSPRSDDWQQHLSHASLTHRGAVVLRHKVVIAI
ncbi:MAG: hypothetical protein ABR529_04075, partial [Actinomycetota bacterium]